MELVGMVIADADKAGRDQAAMCSSLVGVAAVVTVIEPTIGKDVSQHIGARRIARSCG